MSPRYKWAAIAGAVLIGAALAASTATGFPPKFEVGTIAKPGKKVGSSVRDEGQERVRRALRAPVVLGISRKQLDTIAECESHGDPRAVSSDGSYRGKYQFHRGTWASVGGEGDPARAHEVEQDMRAAMLIKQSGSNPWPVCGS